MAKAKTSPAWKLLDALSTDKGSGQFVVENDERAFRVIAFVYPPFAAARLIAAAPEMLDVLTMAKEQCERLPDDAETDCFVQAIEEVMAKAKGKAA